MSALPGIRGQKYADRLFDLSGSITTGGTAQLLLPVAAQRSSLIIENTSASAAMYLELGSGRATCTISSGAVNAITVTNAGFGFTRPPTVQFLGGALGTYGNPIASPTYSIAGLPDWVSPSNPAQAHCVMTGSAGSQTISSIVIDNPGSGYACPPYILLTNDPLDPFGCAVPSAGVGIELIAAGGSYTSNGTVCITDQVSIFCATSSATFTCKFTI